jgi:AraC family transcriptional regulator
MTPTQYRKIKDRQERLPLQYPESGMAALDNQKPKTSVDVSIREMPISKAATMRRIGMNAETCAAAFIELLSWAKGRVAPGPGKLIASYWDNPEVTPIDKCRFDCCLLVPEDIPLDDHVFYQEIGGGIWAFCRFEIGPDEIQTAWEEAFRWLVQSGYECRPLPCCEIYYNDAREHPEGKWIIDIAIPLFNN